MNPYLTATFLLLLTSGCVFADDDAPATPIPAWYLQEIATLTAGGGRWITNNSEYQSDEEPYEAYGTEWKSSFDGTTMTGRLFGIVNGEETGNFWEFRQYWHPEKQVVVVEQFGFGGTVGIGTLWQENGSTKSAQSFHSISGDSSQTGHISFFPDNETHVTDSFDIVDDQWKPRRHYVWRLAEVTN